jgi:hypothetical protein
MRFYRKATTRISAWRDSLTEKTISLTRPVLVVAALIGSQAAVAQDAAAPKADDVGPFMRAKLAHAQDVLAGLALEDYDAIARGAQELALASQAASWQVLQTAEYARQSAEFRRSCETLKKTAKEGNLDGAALAWMEVTMKCVQCHKYVRDEQDTTVR